MRASDVIVRRWQRGGGCFGVRPNRLHGKQHKAGSAWQVGRDEQSQSRQQHLPIGTVFASKIAQTKER